MGQHRGSGMRGGYGRAGAMDHMFMKYYETMKRKKGFVRKPLSRKQRVINIGELDRLLGRAERKGDKLVLDIVKLGYEKLLGGGNAPKNVEVLASSWSKRAEEKMLAAGSIVTKAVG